MGAFPQAHITYKRTRTPHFRQAQISSHWRTLETGTAQHDQTEFCRRRRRRRTRLLHRMPNLAINEPNINHYTPAFRIISKVTQQSNARVRIRFHYRICFSKCCWQRLRLIAQTTGCGGGGHPTDTHTHSYIQQMIRACY